MNTHKQTPAHNENECASCVANKISIFLSKGDFKIGVVAEALYLMIGAIEAYLNHKSENKNELPN